MRHRELEQPVHPFRTGAQNVQKGKSVCLEINHKFKIAATHGKSAPCARLSTTALPASGTSRTPSRTKRGREEEHMLYFVKLLRRGRWLQSTNPQTNYDLIHSIESNKTLHVIHAHSEKIR